MPKSSYATTLTTVLSEIQKRVLKEKGFKKKGNVFNRTTTDGLIQTIAFQSGSYAPFAVDVPSMGFYPNSFYGKFTVNFGVFVPEVAHLLEKREASFIHEYHCEWALRGRIGGESTDKEIWLSLSDVPTTTVEALIPILEQYCFAFLDKLESREQVVAYLKTRSKSSNDRVVLAMILLNQEKKAEAVALLKEQYQASEDHKGHREYLINLANRLELSISLP